MRWGDGVGVDINRRRSSVRRDRSGQCNGSHLVFAALSRLGRLLLEIIRLERLRLEARSYEQACQFGGCNGGSGSGATNGI